LSVPVQMIAWKTCLQNDLLCVGTVENHSKKNGLKTRHTFVKITKIMAVYIAAILLKLMFPTPEKIYCT